MQRPADDYVSLRSLVRRGGGGRLCFLWRPEMKYAAFSCRCWLMLRCVKAAPVRLTYHVRAAATVHVGLHGWGSVMNTRLALPFATIGVAHDAVSRSVLPIFYVMLDQAQHELMGGILLAAALFADREVASCAPFALRRSECIAALPLLARLLYGIGCRADA